MVVSKEQKEQRGPMQRNMGEEDNNEVLMKENAPPELKHAIEEGCRKTHSEDYYSVEKGKQVKCENAVQTTSADSRNTAFQETAFSSGPTSACSWQKHRMTQRGTRGRSFISANLEIHHGRPLAQTRTSSSPGDGRNEVNTAREY
uniref:Uncharacterized protein n=1 Tax=Haemonchus contortus TaxID=6289 RepID=A0A7I4Z2U3_HAECO